MTWNNKLPTQEQDQRTYENSAEARRVTLIDTSGGNISNANPLPVYPTDTTPGTPYKEFKTVIAVFNVETTIITYTVPAGKTFSFSSINVGGDADGEFVIYKDTLPIMVIRNSASERSKFISLSNFEAEENSIIDIKVTNCSPRQNAASYETTLIGGII